MVLKTTFFLQAPPPFPSQKLASDEHLYNFCIKSKTENESHKTFTAGVRISMNHFWFPKLERHKRGGQDFPALLQINQMPELLARILEQEHCQVPSYFGYLYS